MSWATADLSPEQLKLYRGVQRKRYGLSAYVYDMNGRPLAAAGIDPSWSRWSFMVRCGQVRIRFQIKDHKWFEVHRGFTTVRPMGAPPDRDFWTYSVELP